MIAIRGYRLERPIGRGGMSTVYLALQESVQREVALKVLTSALAGEEEFSQRFLHEARIAAGLRHPNIVHIYDVAQDGDVHYIAMEYLPGGPLLTRRRSLLPPPLAMQMLRQIGSALAYSHKRGVVHRDIKPDNILLRDDGEAVLTDFGIARAIDSHRMTRTGSIVGTPHYMSPEQARGAKLDGRSDLYSLGIVLHEMLTGAVPYVADDPLAVGIMHLSAPLPRLPDHCAEFQPILDRLLAKDPNQRFQSGEELLAATGQGLPVQIDHAERPEDRYADPRASRSKKREPVLGDGLLRATNASPLPPHREPPPKRAAQGVRAGFTRGLAVLVIFAVVAWIVALSRDHLPVSARTARLDAANQALLGQRLDDDAQGLGARSLFQTILAEDPDAQSAREGLRQVARAYRDRAREAVNRGDWQSAANDLRQVEQLALPTNEWREVKSQLEAQQQSESRLAELLQLAEEATLAGRIESDAQGIGALSYYAELLRLDSGNAVALAGQRKALVSVASRVDQAIADRRWTDADADIALIARADPLHPDLARLQSSLADARDNFNVEIEKQLDAAERALKARQLDPENPQSAQALFGRVLADQPNNPMARDGIQRVGKLLIEMADAEASNFQFDEADRWLGIARKLQPAPSGLDSFAMGLARRRAAQESRTASRLQSDPGTLIASAYRAMDAGHWLEPPGSSAFDLLRGVLSSDPANAEAKRAMCDMRQRLLSQLNGHLDANRPVSAWKDWVILEAIGQSATDLQSISDRLTASLLGYVAEQLGQGNLETAERAFEHAAELQPNHRDLPSLQARLETARQGSGEGTRPDRASNR